MDIITSKVSWDRFFMQQVYLVASKSKDPRTQVGSVLVKDNVVISQGYNGFPRGVFDLKERYENRELKYKFVAHSEFNAVVNCSRCGISSVGSTLYTTGSPCHECTKAVINGGIVEIVVHQDIGTLSNWGESQKIGAEMLAEAGVRVKQFHGVLGMEVMQDGKLVRV